METRPKIKIEYSTTDKVLEHLGWLTLLVLWVLIVIKYPSLPEIIPTHFDATGRANDYGGKGTLFMLPAIGTGVLIGLTVLNLHPHIFNYPVRITANNALRQYTNATRMLRALKFVFALTFLLISFVIIQVVTGNMAVPGVWLMLLILGLIFIPLTYFLIKSIKDK